jgi:transposase
MIDYQTFLKIKSLQQQAGLKCSQIAANLGLDERTVASWLSEKHYRPRESSQRNSKLDPFKDDIVRLLETHPYSAMQILQRIRDDGFDGGYSIVKEYVRKVRPKRVKAFLKCLPRANAPKSTGAATARLRSEKLAGA